MNLPRLEALARAVDQCAADGLQGQKKQRNVAVSRSSGTEGDNRDFFERATFERLAATRRSSATVWFQHVHVAALSLPLIFPRVHANRQRAPSSKHRSVTCFD